MRSLLTTAPMVVRLRCSAIGPSSVLERGRRPRRACPGSGSACCRWRGGGDGEAPGEAAGEPDGAGDALGRGWGSADGARAGAALAAAALPLAPGASRWPPASRSASRDGVGRRDDLEEVGRLHGLDLDEARSRCVIATASRPCLAKTASTWSGVTFGSSNRISHFVPPV